MSGTVGLQLCDRPRGSVRWLGQGDPVAVHREVTAEIARHLSPAHAALLARPAQNEGDTVWFAPGSRIKAFAELGAPNRHALTAAITAILSDIRRLAESGVAPAVAATWPALREIPDLDCIFAVDGRPVLTAWGHVGARADRPPGLLARFDDDVPLARPPDRRRTAWVLTAAMLAVFALLAWIVLPPVGAWLVAPLPQCGADPSGIDLLREARDAAARKDALVGELARLEEERGRRRIACAIPQVPQKPSVLADAPPPAKPVDLPKEKWDRADLSMLEGCWRNTTDLTTRAIETEERNAVQSWEMCFDKAGSGRQTMRWTDGLQCEGPLQARFEGGKMQIAEPERCDGKRRLFPAKHECTRISDNEANCERAEIANPRNRQSGRFRR